MKYDYQYIKALSKELKTTITELIALAPQNDPFYVGTQGDIDKAQWFYDLWQRAGYTNGVHIRKAHYYAVSVETVKPDGKIYENTIKDWQYLNIAAKYARYLGYIDPSDIADHKNPDPTINTNYSYSNIPRYGIDIPELVQPEISVGGQSVADVQPYHLEVWCEKSTMDTVLKPVCNRYSANLATFAGETTLTACNSLIKRIKQAGGKPTRIFYISDFDPAGNSMPVAMARKMEWLLSANGMEMDLEVIPIALTLEQVKQYKLPRTPIKESERRAASFEDNFGVGGVELDALDAIYPGVLGDIVGNAIAPYYSQQATNELINERARLQAIVRARVNEITSRYADEIKALEAMTEELNNIEIDTTPFKVERYKAHVISNGNVLFDSTRNYVDQLEFYKQHKGGA